MERRTDHDSTRASERDHVSAPESRRRYATPVLERLGSWRALTLEQSVGITWIRLRDAGYDPDQVWWWFDGR